MAAILKKNKKNPQQPFDQLTQNFEKR